MTKKIFFPFILCSRFLFASHEEMKEPIEIFSFKNMPESPCFNHPELCDTKSSLIDYALRLSYDSRSEVQNLYQVRAQVLNVMGQILPHIVLSSALQFPAIDTLGALGSFGGVFFPNRWFRWKESRKNAKAELESYKTILADTTNGVLQIYYAIQMQMRNLQVIRHYKKQVDVMIQILESQKGRKIKKGTIGILKNISSQFDSDRAYQDNLSFTYPQLSQAIGKEIKPEGNEFYLLPMVIKSFLSVSLITDHEQGQYVTMAKERSPELSYIKFQIAAARANNKSNYFDFFDPENGTEMGLGYEKRIKISKSNISKIEIQKKQIKSQIQLNVFNHVNDYNNAVEVGKITEDALSYMGDLLKSVNENLLNEKKTFRINQAFRFFQIAYSTTLRYSNAQFGFQMAKANLHRDVWHGKYFDQVLTYMEHDMKDQYKEVKKSYSLRRKVFHKLIK